jgi:hypothetical protein
MAKNEVNDVKFNDPEIMKVPRIWYPELEDQHHEQLADGVDDGDTVKPYPGAEPHKR